MDIPLKSIKSFCSGIIDYAGLFPPAKLDLNIAFENYIKYKNSSNANMLSRFIIPSTMLTELENLITEKFNNEKEILLSVIIDSGKYEENFFINFENALSNIYQFSIKFSNSVNADLLEIKVPGEVLSIHKESYLSDFIDKLSESISNKLSKDTFFFIEGNLDGDWKNIIKKLINGIYHHNLNNYNAGFKLRTGGIKPEMFPSSEQIAYAIKECIDRNVKMKCTAGLHHPFRHYDYELRTFMHGFINVFSAGLIAYRHNLSMNGMNEIINDENGNDFVFSMNCFSWKDWKICIEEIELARSNLMISFGSCSFDEPVDDLKKLKLL